MKKRTSLYDILLVALLCICAVLCVCLAIARREFILPALLIAAVVAAVVFFSVAHVRRFVAKLLTDSASVSTRTSLARVGMAALVIKNNNVLWYNEAFHKDILAGKDACLLPINKIFPAISEQEILSESGQNLENDGQRYTAYGVPVEESDVAFLILFVNNTVLKRQSGEYIATRPSVMLITVDTYDAIIKDLKESERARIITDIECALEKYVAQSTGFLRRIGTARYMVVVEERHMQDFVKNRFNILDTVRDIGGDEMAVTLSIGVGRLGKTFRECEEMAKKALDMALGRGGDQVAVKNDGGFEFYGGVSRSVQKRSKVKSRVVATALRDLIMQAPEILIMGHRQSDLDAIGAATGVLRMCQICQKPAAIVVDERQTLAGNLIDQLRQGGYNSDFMRPNEALEIIKKDTLLVIVDTHIQALLESPALYHAARNVAVIDHHRKAVGHIDNAVLFYHEPGASSASEMVAEMLGYFECEKELRPTPLDACALLAGVMLDTRNFSIHTGVRTFEAAAYLRQLGAQTQQVKKLFNCTFESYAYRAQLVTDAEIYLGCAIVTADSIPPELDVVVPQTANDLLTIDGVEASFVAVNTGDQITISARSMGEVNVQVVMETLGGGGHLMMAGAQLKNTSIEDAKTQLFEAITQYRETQRRDK